MSEDKLVAEKTDENKLYELSFHIVSSVAPEKVSDEFSLIKKTLSNHSAEIISEKAPALMNLSYTMVKKVHDTNYKYDKAYFGSIKFNATAEAVESIKLEVEKIENILRFLLIKTIDDFEHSTNKILTEKEKKAKAEEAAEEAEEAEEVEANDAEEADDKSDAESDLDEAIDELVK